MLRGDSLKVEVMQCYNKTIKYKVQKSKMQYKTCGVTEVQCDCGLCFNLMVDIYVTI